MIFSVVLIQAKNLISSETLGLKMINYNKNVEISNLSFWNPNSVSIMDQDTISLNNLSEMNISIQSVTWGIVPNIRIL